MKTAGFHLRAWRRGSQCCRLLRMPTSDKTARVGFLPPGRTSPVTGPGYRSSGRGIAEARVQRRPQFNARRSLRTARFSRTSGGRLRPCSPEYRCSSRADRKPRWRPLLPTGLSIPVVMVAINYDPISRGYIKGLSHSGRQCHWRISASERSCRRCRIRRLQTFPERTKLALLWDRFSIDQFTAADRRGRAPHLSVRAMQLRRPAVRL